MKLFHKSKKPELNDEALDRLLADAYDARLSGLSENECRDKHCLFEPLDNEASAPETHPTSAKAFPLRGRCPSAYTGADEVAPDTQPITTAEPRPIRAVPARSLRWRTAAAAALFLVFVGAGGWLLNWGFRRGSGAPTAPVQPDGTDSVSAPNDVLHRTNAANCHYAGLGGTTVYIFDAAYEGEYDILDANALIYGGGAQENELREELYELYQDGRQIDLSSALPESLKKQQILSYDEYRSFCEHWDLNAKYDDPDQNYLVYTFAYMSTNREVRPILTDVTWWEGATRLYLWVNDPNPYVQYRALFPAIRVLVVPTTNRAESVELCTVLKQEDYDWRLEGYRYFQASLAEQLASFLQNCHAEKIGKVTAWVLNNPEAEYEGEYDLQKASKDSSFFNVIFDVGLDYWLPEGFAQKKIMSFEEYASYCESFDLEQKYDDPNMCYAIYAWAFANPGVQAPGLADVVQSGDAVHVFLHNPGADGIQNRSTDEAWVLVLPVSADTETLEVFDVLSETEYQYRKLLNQTVMENNTEGKLCITGIANTLINYEFSLGFPAEKEYAAVWLQYEGTEIHISADDKTEWVNADGTPFKKEDYEAITNTPYGQVRPRICVVAENCNYVDGVSMAPRVFYNCYHAERIVIYTGEEADRILREAQTG